MPTRRDALKTLAGASVVGSLSGCVQLATQRTNHFNGTPAMVEMERGAKAGETMVVTPVGIAVGVEARRTIERFGVTREIVTHNWGMLYDSFWQDGIAPNPYTLATFTTPSIKIAGKELNPIKDLTVRGIGNEFLSITRKRPGRTKYSNISMAQVDDATGKKVLGAFRDSVGSPSAEYEPPSLDTSEETLSTVPDWDGDTYTFEVTYREGNDPHHHRIVFEKHSGDFVVIFGMAPTGSDLYIPEGSIDRAERLAHPSDDDFSQEMLRRHLIETNLRGSLGLVKQGRKLIDETQELLAEVKNDTRNEEDDRFIVITDTQDDLKQLDTVLGEMGEDLQSITGGSGDDTLTGGKIDSIRERSKKAASIAARAHERVASYNNDTRDEEDDRFVAIERNLNGLRSAAETVSLTLDGEVVDSR